VARTRAVTPVLNGLWRNAGFSDVALRAHRGYVRNPSDEGRERSDESTKIHTAATAALPSDDLKAQYAKQDAGRVRRLRDCRAGQVYEGRRRHRRQARVTDGVTIGRTPQAPVSSFVRAYFYCHKLQLGACAGTAGYFGSARNLTLPDLIRVAALLPISVWTARMRTRRRRM
jgi:hypothetical protein